MSRTVIPYSQLKGQFLKAAEELDLETLKEILGESDEVAIETLFQEVDANGLNAFWLIFVNIEGIEEGNKKKIKEIAELFIDNGAIPDGRLNEQLKLVDLRDPYGVELLKSLVDDKLSTILALVQSLNPTKLDDSLIKALAKLPTPQQLLREGTKDGSQIRRRFKKFYEKHGASKETGIAEIDKVKKQTFFCVLLRKNMPNVALQRIQNY